MRRFLPIITILTSILAASAQAGLAWWVKKYAPNNQVQAQLHAEARKAHRGLWYDPNPQTPWWYRQVGK